MTDQLLAEFRKMRSTRTNLGLLTGMIALILLITLLTGAALGAVLLVASMLTTPQAPASPIAAATPAPASSATPQPSPATPAPTIRTSAGLTRPAAVDWPGKKRPKFAAASITAR